MEWKGTYLIQQRIKINDILKSLGRHAGKKAQAMIFVKDVSNACEIGTEQRGEAVLTRK